MPSKPCASSRQESTGHVLLCRGFCKDAVASAKMQWRPEGRSGGRGAMLSWGAQWSSGRGWLQGAEKKKERKEEKEWSRGHRALAFPMRKWWA